LAIGKVALIHLRTAAAAKQFEPVGER
jgi:hypothetical protein